MKNCFFCQIKRHPLNSASALTKVVPGRQVLILAAGVSLLPVQQEVIDHLFLVLPVDDNSGAEKENLQVKKDKTIKSIPFGIFSKKTNSLTSNSSQFKFQSGTVTVPVCFILCMCFSVGLMCVWVGACVCVFVSGCVFWAATWLQLAAGTPDSCSLITIT